MAYLKYLKNELAEEVTTYEAAEPDRYEPDTHVRSHVYMRTRYTPADDYIHYFPREGLYHNDAQKELFYHSHTPAVNEVRTVSGTERGRAHFPLLLSVANNDSLRKFGIPLSPPDDLSIHSLRVVRNLQNRGLVDPDASIPESPTNSITFDAQPDWHPIYDDQKEIPKREMAAGKSALREMLRKRKNLSNQFNAVAPAQEETHTQLELDL